MKRDCDCFEPLTFNGVLLKSIKRLPADARATQFVVSLVMGANLPADVPMESAEWAEHLKRAWRQNKTRVKPRATKLRVEIFPRKGDGFELVVLIIRFKKRPHKTAQKQVVGVCGTPHGYLWRVRKLGSQSLVV